MLLQVSLLVIFVPCVAAVCEFPSQLRGQWSSEFDSWNSLTIGTNLITGMQPEGRSLEFTCYSKTGDTYIIESEQSIFGNFQFRFYTCLDIVPSAAGDILYFRVLTNPNSGHQNFSVVSFSQNDAWNSSDVCQKESTQVPLHFDVFLRQGFENNMQNDRCPRSLHAEFTANFTDALEFAKCPEGFVIDGCNNRSHLTFNFSECSGDQASNGAPVYMCLTSMDVDNTTYTTIYLPPAQGAQPNTYEIACLEQMTMADGQLSITKSAGACAGMPSVDIVANETVSCRLEIVETTTAGTNLSTQAPPSGSTSPGEGGHGGGGDGDVNDGGNAASTIFAGFTTLLIVSVLGALATVLP